PTEWRRNTGRKLSEAITEIEQALEIEPMNAEAYRELASTCVAIEKFSEAAATFLRAIAMRPSLTERARISPACAQRYTARCFHHVQREQIEDREQALTWTGKPLQHGYSQKLVEDSPSLAELRTDLRFPKLKGTFKQNTFKQKRRNEHGTSDDVNSK